MNKNLKRKHLEAAVAASKADTCFIIQTRKEENPKQPLRKGDIGDNWLVFWGIVSVTITAVTYGLVLF